MNYNQYQSNNLRVLTPEVMGVIKKRQWRDASTALLTCTVCGQKRITGPIVAFYKFKGDDLLCYECQKLSRLPESVHQQRAPVQPHTWPKQDVPMITDKQATLLRSLIIEKVVNDIEREQRLQGISELTKAEAVEAIGLLLKNQI